MKSDLEDLKITQAQIEKLTGFDVNEVFIGGVFGGVYRPSIIHSPKRLAYLGLTEIFIFVLTFIFTIPIGLLAIRNLHQINDELLIIRFFVVTLGISFIVIITWNIYMWAKVKKIKALTYLIDEVDKYNEVVQALTLLDSLESIEPVDFNNRSQIIKILSITRDSLVCGLMSEKILRENRVLLARRYDLLLNIETNFTTLKTLEINQHNEYRQLLNNAFQIGMSVHQEMQNLSLRSEADL